MSDIVLLRKQVDEIDARLLALIAERFAVTDEIGQYKAARGLPARDPAREAKQFDKIRKLAKQHNVSPELSQRILEQIIDEAVKIHQQIKSDHENAV